MVLMTYNEILTKLCDDFDELISPKSITRSNTNIIYLIFKAIAKGYELINSICVVLSNKFNPEKCSVEDLDSVAFLVGTERYSGSASGLHIIATNEGDSAVTILPGTYIYALDSDTTFEFEVLEDTVVEAGAYVTFIAMSQNIGQYPVTAQSSITVTSSQEIPSDIAFSCTDNSSLLGTEAESDLAFRKRIVEGYDNQDSIVELENQLKNLPYLFDCRIKFNNTLASVNYDGITIPPFTALILYSGSPRTEMAEVIANKIVCPTVQLGDSVPIDYVSDVFIGGKHTFYLTPFREYRFNIKIVYSIDEQYISDYSAQKAIREGLEQYFIPEVHKDYVTVDEVFNTIDNLNLTGITVLSVKLDVNGTEVPYVEVPVSRIPVLAGVSFPEEGE